MSTEPNPSSVAPAAATTRELLRHTVATVAYRGGKAVRGAPPEFADFLVSGSSRSPVRILAHIGDLFDWALTMAKGKQAWNDSPPMAWDAEVARFFDALKKFDDYLATDAPLGTSADVLFQGPVADALQHIGQLTMLRRCAGAPIKGESYAKAGIVTGRVGPEQAAPKWEFD